MVIVLSLRCDIFLVNGVVEILRAGYGHVSPQPQRSCCLPDHYCVCCFRLQMRALLFPLYACYIINRIEYASSPSASVRSQGGRQVSTSIMHVCRVSERWWKEGDKGTGAALMTTHSQYFFSIVTTSNPRVSLYKANAALLVLRTCKLTCDALKATFMACSVDESVSANECIWTFGCSRRPT